MSATNALGGRAVLAHKYAVASQLNFQGFQGPVAAIPTLNVVPRGATIPVKWSLPDGNGGYVTNPAAYQSLTATTIPCPSGPTNTITTRVGGSGLSYDATTNSFIYRWTGMTVACKDARITLGDGSTHELWFKVQ